MGRPAGAVNFSLAVTVAEYSVDGYWLLPYAPFANRGSGLMARHRGFGQRLKM
jgi:hypothetical protein